MMGIAVLKDYLSHINMPRSLLVALMKISGREVVMVMVVKTDAG